MPAKKTNTKKNTKRSGARSGAKSGTKRSAASKGAKQTGGGSPKKKVLVCKKCIFWDQRIEGGMYGHIAYCIKKDKNVRAKPKCEFYSEATPHRLMAHKIRTYGEIHSDEDEYEEF